MVQMGVIRVIIWPKGKRKRQHLAKSEKSVDQTPITTSYQEIHPKMVVDH